MSLLFYAGMVVTGIFVGLMNAALGIGGGILMVPALREMVPGMDPHTAKGTSLFIIIFVAAVNAWRQNRGRKEIPWGLAAYLAAGSVVGGAAGAWLTGMMSGDAVTWVFIGLLGIVALRLALSEPHPILDVRGARRTGAALGIGLATGLASGMTGIGGGLVLVSLALLAGLVSNERVTALSNMVMVATCTASATVQLLAERTLALPGTVGQVAILLAPAIFLGAQIGSPVGRWVNEHLSYRQRKTVLAILLAIIAIRMAWQTF